MEVHQTGFVQAVALAGVVALVMIGLDKGREDTPVRAAGALPRTAVTQTGVTASYVVAATRKREVQP